MRAGVPGRHFILPAALCLTLIACKDSPRPAAVLGTAYVGPATLPIRSDFALQSSAVAMVRHGEKLEIIGRRRHFLRVRTPTGAEGWTDERQLLSTGDMAGMRGLAAQAAQMPSQGQATTYEDLNVHTQPDRLSPSFLQIKEGQKVDVLAQLRTPRAGQPRKPLLPAPAKKVKAAEKKPAPKQPKIPPPPMPKAPPLPENWLELSRSIPDADSGDTPETVPEVKPEPPSDAWSLVRTSTGQTGWVFTRRLSMAIPDEVAQYAEGHRIVSYFSLGTVDDGGEQKHMWLWTTVAGSGHPYDFDSMRVFVWSLRKHRYETAYIERNLIGFSPVLLETVDYGKGQQAGEYPGYSACVEKKDGTRVRRQYAVLGNAVRYAGERPCELPPPLVAETQPEAASLPASPEPPHRESYTQRIKQRVKTWFGGK